MDDQSVSFGSLARENNRFPKTIETYIRFHSIENHTLDTQRFYRYYLTAFSKSLEDDRLDRVTTLDVLKHLQDMKERGLAPRSIRSCLQALKTFFTWAKEWELIPANPAEKIRPPKLPKVRKPFLSKEQFEDLIDQCPWDTMLGARRQSMLWILLSSGIRHKELAQLEIDDINWERMYIRIREGKGQRERQVPLHKESQRALIRYLHYRHDEWPCLWVTKGRRPLGYIGIAQDIKRIMERAEVKTQDTLHVFRRTWAANSVRAGIPRPWVQAIGGWQTPDMMDHYVAAMQAEAGALDAFKDFDPFGGQ